VANEVIFQVEVGCVVAVTLLHRFRERILAVGHGHVMDVIVHEHVCPNVRTIFRARIPHQTQVNEPIRVIMENFFLVVASIDDVMGAARNNDASPSWQRNDLYEAGQGNCRAKTLRSQPQLAIVSKFGDRCVDDPTCWVVYAPVPESLN